jgi:hypothetical protein
MRAMVYRGPYRVRVEKKDMPAIEHPNDAITESGLPSELKRHGLSSRLGQHRADLKHQPIDLVINALPWVVAGALAVAVGRAVQDLNHDRGRSRGRLLATGSR